MCPMRRRRLTYDWSPLPPILVLAVLSPTTTTGQLVGGERWIGSSSIGGRGWVGWPWRQWCSSSAFFSFLWRLHAGASTYYDSLMVSVFLGGRFSSICHCDECHSPLAMLNAAYQTSGILVCGWLMTLIISWVGCECLILAMRGVIWMIFHPTKESNRLSLGKSDAD